MTYDWFWLISYDGGIKWIMLFVTWICGFSAGVITTFLFFIYWLGRQASK